MFQVLAERLHQLQELLSIPLFSEAWQMLAHHLNQACDECRPQFLAWNRPPVQNISNVSSLSELYYHCHKPTSTITITSNVKLKEVCMIIARKMHIIKGNLIQVECLSKITRENLTIPISLPLIHRIVHIVVLEEHSEITEYSCCELKYL
jgi:hypothetical protein